jgi:hypothetical protein
MFLHWNDQYISCLQAPEDVGVCSWLAVNQQLLVMDKQVVSHQVLAAL